MKGNNLNSIKDYSVIFSLAGIAFALIAIASIPKWRTGFKAIFQNDARTVLAQVEGRLMNGQGMVKVLKVHQRDEIHLEVYSLNEDGSPIAMIAKIPLDDHRDASINLQGNVSNLALIDIKQDGHLEILAPTYDEQMVPHLNAFQYNIDSRSFEKVTVPEGNF